MVVSLYIMTVCFWLNGIMQAYSIEKARLIVLWIGIVFFWVASACYDKTINDLKKEIKELKRKVDGEK